VLTSKVRRPEAVMGPDARNIRWALFILISLVFSKFFYLESIRSYFTFYLVSKFHVGVQHAQLLLFLFLFSVAAGTILGGLIGDRFGRKYVIWVSILGAAPLTLLLPYVNLGWTIVLSILIGIILSSAFPAILVYAQELVPGKKDGYRDFSLDWLLESRALDRRFLANWPIAPASSMSNWALFSL
jgi:MFS transporter, FSR family, fosmidomycin resistance protein